MDLEKANQVFVALQREKLAQQDRLLLAARAKCVLDNNLTKQVKKNDGQFIK